ncbi:MAG: hypothetical protein IH586_04955, partial [Anaerolineaceae bacterium]|nr:hypothetical protein [Anaerolineaceae bacterium]
HMFLQKPARQLLEHQIDFDVVPSDLFADMDTYQASFDGVLKVNGEQYQAFVVPYAEFITRAVAVFAAKASKAGFPVIFIDGLPGGISDCQSNAESEQLVQGLQQCSVVPLAELAKELKRSNINDVKVDQDFPRLRYYHYVKNGQDAYMFSNEDPAKTFTGRVILPVQGEVTAYDAMENMLREVSAEETGDGTQISLQLQPYESIVYITDAFTGLKKSTLPSGGTRRELDGEWTLTIASAKEYPQFHDAISLTELHNVGKIWPDFSGFMRYETRVEVPDAVHAAAVLTIENAYEGVEVWVNGEAAGMKICPPYVFDVSGLLKPGENTVRIEVANTLYRKVTSETKIPNYFGPRCIVVEPSGIVGKIALVFGN